MITSISCCLRFRFAFEMISHLTKRDRAQNEQEAAEEDACWAYTVCKSGECAFEAVEAPKH